LVLLIVSLLVALVLLFISPLTEYLIEKNSKEWVGRKIEMDNLYINLLTGNLEIDGLKCYEKNDSTIFVSIAYLDVNTTIYKILFGNYAISDLTVDSFYVRIAQSNTGFNFDDLIPVVSASKTDSVPEESIRYELKNVELTNGIIDYLSTDFSNKITLLDFTVLSDGLTSEQEMVNAIISYSLGKEGKVTNAVAYNMNSADFTAAINSERLDLSSLTPYFRDLISIDAFGAYFGCDLKIKGNGNEPANIALKGSMTTNDIFMTDPRQDTLISLSRFYLSLDTVNLKNNLIDIRNLQFNRFYLRLDLYENGLNNFTALMKTNSTVHDLSDVDMEASNPFNLVEDYINTVRSESKINSYSIDSFLVDNGHVIFDDYTLYETFTYDISQLKIWSDNLDSKDSSITIEATALLNNRGHTEAAFAFYPSNVMDMNLYYRITDLQVADISPYSKFYVAHPFQEGNLSFESNTTLRKMVMDSKNQIHVTHIKVGNKSDKPALYDMPIKLAVALLKDNKGNIDIDLPIEGDMNDPNYHLGKIIWNIIKNLIIKAVTAPYKLLANAFGAKEDDLRELKFEYMQNELSEKQLNQIKPLINIIESKPELMVTIRQLTEPAKEEERWAAVRAREIYYHSMNGGSVDDILTSEQAAQLNALTIKDSLFLNWADSILGTSYKIVPIQQKVVQLAGADNTRQAVKRLQDNRNLSLKKYLIESGADSSRIKVYTEDPAVIPPAETREKFLIEFGVDQK